ncbi:A/G-specific adenine glycosylase [Marinilabilia sp.]|uniref:A/G-specific adenine glycosylase n=1 Tax=Marinilabilia sp. TaxID=2021252 RepID=UPI0025BF52B0|nr:A/G-specific adenine glycosylase [Marinilabilia sp.]
MHKILIMTNFPEQIREWYFQHGRKLPWRETKDPYKIWISEIILQQTRVDQGMEYFHRFIKAFPNVKSLAKASETKLMQLWQGLGYYSRARNLQYAAQTIVNEHNATIPQTYKKIKTLKGIGPYTAAAIASFAYNLPHAVVDGNVYRVLSRIYAKDIPIDSSEGEKFFSSLANELLDKKDPATHNQAIMDLGALVCKPAKPLCGHCPVNLLCAAFATGTQQNYPVKGKRITRKIRHLNFLVFIRNEQIVIEKRSGNDIWKGLFQFPVFESTEPFTTALIKTHLKTKTQLSVEVTKLLEKKHLLTHQELHAVFFRVEFTSAKDFREWFNTTSYETIALNRLNKIPFPQLIKKNLKKLLPPCEY